MTIDEAIKYCEEVAEQNDKCAESYTFLARHLKSTYERLSAAKCRTDCAEGAEDYRQLADWLRDLKEAKKLIRKVQNEMLKGTSCNPTAFLAEHDELMDKLTEGVEYLDD